jgi:hypothetical protein
MKIKALFATSFIAFASFSWLGYSKQPTFAQQPLSTCQNALLDAGRTLRDGRDLRITNVRLEHLSSQYRSFPANRPDSVLLAMEGRAVYDVMASGQFMTILATRIMNGCSSIGMVSFGQGHSDWVISFGMVNGQVESFYCLEFGSSRVARWGEQYC